MRRMKVFLDGEEVISGEVEAMTFELGVDRRVVGPKMSALVHDGTGDLKVKFSKLGKVAFEKGT